MVKVDILIVDADSLAFKSSRETYDESINNFVVRINGMRMNIQYNKEIYLLTTGRSNFRYLLDKEYKANRLDKIAPEFVKGVKDFMKENLDTIVYEEYEADDLAAVVARMCRENGLTYIVAHIDSDLNQIEGLHYNYDKSTFYSVSKEQAQKDLFKQILTGASKDNIKGLPGFGIGAWDKVKDNVKTIFDVHNIYIKGIPKDKATKQREIKGLGEECFDYFTQQVGLTTLLDTLEEGYEEEVLAKVLC